MDNQTHYTYPEGKKKRTIKVPNEIGKKKIMMTFEIYNTINKKKIILGHQVLNDEEFKK